MDTKGTTNTNRKSGGSRDKSSNKVTTGIANVTSVGASMYGPTVSHNEGTLPPVETPTTWSEPVVVEKHKQELKEGSGRKSRQAAFYLSRVTPTRTPAQSRPQTRHSMKEHQDLISQSIILEANGPGSKDNKKVSDNPNLDLYEAMFRQFTFTGYDIMQDEAPKKPVKPKKDTTEIAKYSAIYVDACKKMGLVPVTYLAERLAEKEVEMNSHGLGPQGAKAVAIALVRNDKVQYLSIEDNWIGIEGASYIAEMLTENFTITELNLAENRIGSEGAIDILKVLLENTSIKMLDLSGNDIHDDAMGDLAEVLMENIYLRELRLSHNQIGEDGGPILARALKSNDSLEVLDISWNHLRGKAVTAIAGCLQYNVGLRMLDISWNGFALDGCRVLGKALIANKTLQDLDISSNRLHPQAIAELMKGVKDNQGLVKISISSNPITPKLALAILQSLDKCNPLSELSEVDMWDVVVTQEFVNFLEEMQKKRELVVKYGPIMGKNDHRHYTSDAALGTTDPLEILFNFMTREGMRVVDLFNRFDTDGSSSVSRAEFRDGLLGVNAPLTRGQLDVLLEQLDEDGDGEVDLREIFKQVRDMKRRRIQEREEEKIFQRRVKNELDEFSEFDPRLQKLANRAIQMKKRKESLQNSDTYKPPEKEKHFSSVRARGKPSKSITKQDESTQT